MAQGTSFNVPWAFFHCFLSSAVLLCSCHSVAAPVPILQAVAHSGGAGCWCGGCGGCGGHHHCLFGPVCVLGGGIVKSGDS